jgi:hypothetical protein
MKTKLWAVLALVAGALALAACGSSSDTTSSSTSSSTDLGSSSTTASTSTTESTSTTTGDVGSFCDEVKSLQTLGTTFSSLSDNDISGAQDAFQQADAQIQKVDEAAPDAVKADADGVRQAFDAINQKIQGVSSPDEMKALGPDVRPLLATLATRTQALQAYTQKNC